MFSAVRAYAREVHIDPEPIVERLRAEFADKDALDALHALDATGVLDAKNLANARRSREEQSNLLRNAAIAAGVVLMPRTATVIPGLQETVATVGAVSDALGSSGLMQQIEFPSPARIEEPADTPANIKEFRPEAPVLATAP